MSARHKDRIDRKTATDAVFTGGGSGGHVYPGLAVIESIERMRPGTKIVWIGSHRGLEQRIVGGWKIPYIGVPTGKLRREFSLKNVTDVFKVIGGIAAAWATLKRLAPRVVFSKGGYVSVPVVVAARMLHIPVYTHESDVDPGLATRINSRFADVIFVAYDETIGHFRANRQAGARRDPNGKGRRRSPKFIVSGNPVRTGIFSGNADRGLRFGRAGSGPGSDAFPILLVLGGSQGARQINDIVRAALPGLVRTFFVIHQTGDTGEEAANRPHTGVGDSDVATAHYCAVPFINEEMADLLAAAEIVVARAGAGTVWELAVTGKPSLLIPLRGAATRGDQVRNAELFEGAGAALVFPQDGDSDTLIRMLTSLHNDGQRRSAMSEAARSFAHRDAADTIATHLLTHLDGQAAGHVRSEA